MFERLKSSLLSITNFITQNTQQKRQTQTLNAHWKQYKASLFYNQKRQGEKRNDEISQLPASCRTKWNSAADRCLPAREISGDFKDESDLKVTNSCNHDQKPSNYDRTLDCLLH